MADRDPETGRFLKGCKGGGRPAGSRNKLGEAFLKDLHEAWEQQGIEVIQKVIADKPDQFLRVVASILPKEMSLEVKKTNIEDFTDDEIRAILESAGWRDGKAGDSAEQSPSVH